MINSYEPVFPSLVPPSGGARSRTPSKGLDTLPAELTALSARKAWQRLRLRASDLALWAFATLIGISPLA
jgi:hypothetical protein